LETFETATAEASFKGSFFVLVGISCDVPEQENKIEKTGRKVSDFISRF